MKDIKEISPICPEPGCGKPLVLAPGVAWYCDDRMCPSNDPDPYGKKEEPKK